MVGPTGIPHIGHIPRHRPPNIAPVEVCVVRSSGAWTSPRLPGRPRCEREHELERVRIALRAAGQASRGSPGRRGCRGMGSRGCSRRHACGRRTSASACLRRGRRSSSRVPGRCRAPALRAPIAGGRRRRARPLAGGSGGAGRGGAHWSGDVRLQGATTRPSRGRFRLCVTTHGLYWLASNLAARARGRRPAVVRRAVGARARVHRAPAGWAAAGAYPRHPAARSRADARSGDARWRSRRRAAGSRRVRSGAKAATISSSASRSTVNSCHPGTTSAQQRQNRCPVLALGVAQDLRTRSRPG
jgi:hypothetical protein